MSMTLMWLRNCRRNHSAHCAATVRYQWLGPRRISEPCTPSPTGECQIGRWQPNPRRKFPRIRPHPTALHWGSVGSLWDHKFEKLIFIGTESYTFVIERPRGRVLGKWGPALAVVLVLSEAIWVIIGTFCAGLRECCGIIMCCLQKALKRIQVL